MKITENELFVLKFLNVLNSNFEKYLIIFNKKVRRNENLLNLNTLIIRLKQEKHRMKTQEKQINVLHRHQNNDNFNNFEKRNFRDDRKDRGQNKKNKNVDNERNNNKVNDDVDEKND